MFFFVLPWVGWGIASENCYQVEGSPQSSLSWASEVAVKVGHVGGAFAKCQFIYIDIDIVPEHVQLQQNTKEHVVYDMCI